MWIVDVICCIIWSIDTVFQVLLFFSVYLGIV